jgi:signal transduction histidine kinase
MNDLSMRVLIVDDERDFLENLAQRLRLRGLAVSTAASGPDAIAQLQQNEIDVVVLDVRMPGMDGIETLRRIKDSWPRVEVVMLTGHADLESSLDGMRFGFFDYLTKPVEIDALVAKLEDAYRRGQGLNNGNESTFGGKLKHHMIVADRLASLGELSASIAHEINNPLAVIGEAAGLLRSRVAKSPPLPEEVDSTVTSTLDAIERAVERATRITRNFLRFARSSDSVAQDVDLAELAREVIQLTAKTAAHSGAEVALESPDEPLILRTDSFQLRQVLLNLMTNALQAVSSGGHVRVRITSDRDSVVIAIEDDGPGIPDQDLERIFEPFFTTKPDGQGTGLGLAVSRGLVEKLGGRIEVDSRPGNGCVFRVVLDRDRENRDHG